MFGQEQEQKQEQSYGKKEAMLGKIAAGDASPDSDSRQCFLSTWQRLLQMVRFGSRSLIIFRKEERNNNK